jgi:hypothetical protein
MTEKKGCGCGKKNAETPPPPENPQPQTSDTPEFRTGQATEGGVKKN